MKNIHILPTYKPSRLIKSIDKGNLYLSKLVVCGSKWENQNIYITSDEEITVNDYITDGYLVWKWKDDSSLLGRKKVILTTDQDLIGVQAIDDEFLEWFVAKANDSEKPIDIIEVEKEIYEEIVGDDFQKNVNYYAIIIPKEEPKQDKIMERFIANAKQETIEEVKCIAGCKYFYGREVRHHKNCIYYPESFSKLYDDLKTQQERSYNEGEVVELLRKRDKHTMNNLPIGKWLNPKDWFETNKKQII